MSTTVPRTETSERKVRLESRRDKQPLKVNIFDLATRNLGQIQLVPVFPYMGDGSIVPCLALSIGGPDYKDFLFFHHNSRQEHFIMLATHGCGFTSGQMVGPSSTDMHQEHGVTTFLADLHDPESYFIALITIRVNDEPEEMEGVSLRCQNCSTVVFRRDFDVKSGPAHEHLQEFYALGHYTEAFNEFNRSEANRVCPQCGEVQPVVPVEQFGHWRYHQNVRVADRGLSELIGAGSRMNTGSPTTGEDR